MRAVCTGWVREFVHADAPQQQNELTVDILFSPFLTIHPGEHAPGWIFLGAVLEVSLLPVGDLLEFASIRLSLGRLHKVQVAIEVVLERFENMCLQASVSQLMSSRACRKRKPHLHTASSSSRRQAHAPQSAAHLFILMHLMHTHPHKP